MRRPGWFALRSMGLLGIAVVVGAPSAPAPSQAPARQCNLLGDTDPNSPDKKNPILTPIDASTRNAILTSGLPCAEVMTDQGPEATGVENRQRGFDFYSWLTFIALNAPGDKKPDIATARPATRTVWEDRENFIPLLDVMLPGGAKPDWDKRAVPPACRAQHDADPSLMVVQMIEESFNQPFRTGPLIDQNNNYAIFDILMNWAMFDLIVSDKNPLYSRVLQASESNANLRVDFPSGRSKNDDKDGPPGHGSIMIKVSWKILAADDDRTKFHHVEALVAMPATEDQQMDPPCLRKTLGLIGFHVVHKTARSGRSGSGPRSSTETTCLNDPISRLSNTDPNKKLSPNIISIRCRAATSIVRSTKRRPGHGIPSPRTNCSFA